jgi:pimeloyl-ACP methyl ester carboxylesterase
LSLPSPRAVYLPCADPVFAFFHDAEDRTRRRQAIVMFTPFGWGEMSSYRGLRSWAVHLAESGYPTLRMDLPGTGDSGGSPRDPARLQAWTAASCEAARWVRTSTGCEKVAAIGISLGGMVACCSLAAGAPIDEVILWAVPSEGRTFLREIRAFAMRLDTGEGQGNIQGRDDPPSGEVAAGFILSADTVAALEELELAALEFPPDRPSRALLLQRDGIALDARIARRLEQVGVDVTVSRGEGYGAMMTEAERARAPSGLFDPIEKWLERSPLETPASEQTRSASAAGPAAARASTEIELSIGSWHVRERPLTVDQPFGRLFGILAEPAEGEPADLCAVFLNAGAIRHIGPNRMWVEAARRWASRGVRSLRLDLEGLGDADGEWSGELAGLYVQARVQQTLAAVEELAVGGLGRRFMLVGLCSGAHWSFHGALQDERVVAAVMLNPEAIFWEPSLGSVRAFRRRASGSSLRRALRRGVRLSQIATAGAQVPTAFGELARGRRERSRKLDRALDQLARADKNVTFAFSGEPALWQELRREGRLEQDQRTQNVTFEALSGTDHILRPLQAQRDAHAALDRALDRELERLRAALPIPHGDPAEAAQPQSGVA